MNSDFTKYFERLIQYISMHGVSIDIGKNGKCPIKDHKSFSPFVVNKGRDGDLVWHCFACNDGGTIFELAAILYGYPKSSEYGFYSVTVQHIADIFNLSVPKRDKVLNSHERFIKDLYSATRDITNSITLEIPEIIEYVKKRKWSLPVLKKLGVGGIKQRQRLNKHMSTTYSTRVLNSIGFSTLQKDFLFSTNRIIFPIHDSYGRTVGFTSRLLQFESGMPYKYINSKTSPIFKKKDILYNIHRARKALEKGVDKVLYIVEGQADVLTLNSFGIESVVALSGIAFTDGHIDLIKDFKTIICCLDGDQGGEAASRKLYSKYAMMTNNMLYLLPMPNSIDPDEFILQNGLQEFLNLSPLLPQEWEIKTETILTKRLLVDYWIPRIAKLNSLYHSRIIKILSDKSEVSEKEIKTRINLIMIDEISQVLAEGIAKNKLNINIERI